MMAYVVVVLIMVAKMNVCFDGDGGVCIRCCGFSEMLMYL